LSAAAGRATLQVMMRGSRGGPLAGVKGAGEARGWAFRLRLIWARAFHAGSCGCRVGAGGWG